MNAVFEVLKENKARLFQKYPLKSLALFGSRSRGDFKEDSDVDVLVEFSKPVGIEFIRLAHDLEDLFHKKVDLVSHRALKSHYSQYIEKDMLYV